ncbi:unnamed protein product [Brachionus calyciflorus]|uniref:Chitin-binding type-2 domain-containing protein n=1 Tax=Brachionus calyciflorus TaxID=104777 RepID=A0A814ERA5_9BILA|nr:unnamed protein product [Brachionus calyciflorus]
MNKKILLKFSIFLIKVIFVIGDNKFKKVNPRGINVFKIYENSERRLPPKTSDKFSCSDKLDESYYAHHDCHKYWHCLYVGTVFESALERKCPAGTMFHPIQRNCETSASLTCLNWYKFIYGKDYEESQTSADDNQIIYTTPQLTSTIIDDSHELNEFLQTYKHEDEKTTTEFVEEYVDEIYTDTPEIYETTFIETTTPETTTTTKTTTTTTRTTTTKRTSTTLSTTKTTRTSKTTTKTTIKTTITRATTNRTSTMSNTYKHQLDESYDIEEDDEDSEVDDENEYNYYDSYKDSDYSDYPTATGSYMIQINTTKPSTTLIRTTTKTKTSTPTSTATTTSTTTTTTPSSITTQKTETTTRLSSKFSTIFSSNLLEKLRNFESNEKNNSANVKNYTILTSNGKKTFITSQEIITSSSKMTHKTSTNKAERILSTKQTNKHEPIDIIKNIFSINNRNSSHNLPPNLTSRLFITEKMYAKTTTDQIQAFYEDVQPADEEEVEGEDVIDEEISEVEAENVDQENDLLLNLQLNTEGLNKTTETVDYENYSDEESDNLQHADHTTSSAITKDVITNIDIL